MDPLIGYGLLQTGGSILDWFGGKGRRDKAEREYQGAKDTLWGTVDDQPFDPWQIQAAQKRAVAPDVRALGAHMDRRLGLDTGQGQGALWGEVLDRQYGKLPDLLMTADMEKYRRAWQVASQLYQGAGNRWEAAQ
jgi:hypothetical protein